MGKLPRRLGAFALSLALLAVLARPAGRAGSDGVYFTAANEQLLELSADTMPFYSGGILYVSSRLFEGTELGVSYAFHPGLGLAMLYMHGSALDLRFDMAGQLAYDKQGNLYTGYAIERGGVVFFPLNLVCRYFGLSWNYIETDPAPLIRVKSGDAILDDNGFVSAASSLMADRYAEYERSLSVRPPAPPAPPVQTEPPPEVQAAEGQKVYLIFDGQAAREVLPALEGAGATFLLDPEQLEDGDLLRALAAGGHAAALRVRGETEEEAAAELRRGREALWDAARCWLELVWYGGGEELSGLFADGGFVRVRAAEDLSGEDAGGILRAVGQRREDVAVYLGGEDLPALPETLAALAERRYRLSAWRLTA